VAVAVVLDNVELRLN